MMTSLHMSGESLTKSLEDQTRIIEWGRCSQGGLPTGKESTGSTPAITEDEFLAIDRQVARLDHITKQVIKELYIKERSINKLASILTISNRRVMQFRDQGLNRILGGLTEIREQAKRH